MTFAAGMRRSSNATAHVELARMPSFCSFLSTCTPMSFVAAKHVMPLYPAAGSTVAKMRKTSASAEFVIHIFEPLMM
jgi:hypothetical protein